MTLRRTELSPGKILVGRLLLVAFLFTYSYAGFAQTATDSSAPSSSSRPPSSIPASTNQPPSRPAATATATFTAKPQPSLPPTNIPPSSAPTAPEPRVPSSAASTNNSPTIDARLETRPTAPAAIPNFTPSAPNPILPSDESSNTSSSRENNDHGKTLQRSNNSFFNSRSEESAVQTIKERVTGSTGGTGSTAKKSSTIPPLREWLVFSQSLQQAETQRRALLKWQVKIIRRTHLKNIGRVISVFRIPDTIDISELSQSLKTEFPDWTQEANQRFLPLSNHTADNDDPVKNWGQKTLGISKKISSNCSKKIVIAMLDSGVNTQLAAFSAADIHYKNLAATTPENNGIDGSFRHGTGVAAILLGQQQVNGMLPNATLHALNIFSTDSDAGLHTRSDWIFSALNEVAGIRPAVQIVNLSFGGSYSAEMDSIFQSLNKRMLFVAAAGNSGDNNIQFPAAYDNVIAVGAINSELEKSATSSYGKNLDLVAPGEDIWTIDENGNGYFASGTSFAAPFVTAILALSNPAPAKNNLPAQIKDLGEAGHDLYYGAGLPQVAISPTSCR
jgi:hypothetical protein